MRKRLTDDFNRYLMSKGIVLDFNKEIEREDQYRITFEEASEKLELLADIHKGLKGYVGDIGNHLPNAIGALMENYKAQLRRLKRDVNYLKNASPANFFEEEVKSHGEVFINRGERSIALALSSDYIKRIYRSMNNNEICLGAVDIENYFRKEGSIYIKDMGKCSYNLWECDVIDFINRLKKRKVQLPYDKLIKIYIEASGLEGNSFDFIRGMINYPYEYVKVCTRYRTAKKPWTPEKYADSLMTAMIKDGEEI